MAVFWPSEWFWSEEDRSTLLGKDDLSTTKSGFITIEPKEFPRETLSDLKGVILSEKWAELDEKTRYVFDEGLDPFPYDYKRPPGPNERPRRPRARVDDPSKDPWPRRMLSAIAGFRLPPNFSIIHMDNILDRFPSAQGVDGDIRGYVTALRYVYGKSLWKLIWLRRSYATVASFLIVSSYALGLWLARGFAEATDLTSYIVGLGTTELAAAAYCAIAAIFVFWWILNYPRLTDEFLHSVETSCSRVANAVVQRFTYLRRMSKDLHDEIPKRNNYKDPSHHWPEGSHRWAQLAIWMSMRAQSLENFFQVEMWRMRRMEAWIRFIGYVVTVLTLLLALIGLVIATMQLWPNEGDPPAPVLPALPVLLAMVAGSAVSAYFLFFMNRIIFRVKRTGRNILEKNLGTSISFGAGDSKLHELSGETYGQLISDILYVETLGRPAAQHQR